MEFLARPGQPLIDHLTGVAEKARDFAEEFHNPDWGYWLGMLHDLGKYNPEWQRYLKHNNGIDSGESEDDVSSSHPNHSNAGAIYAVQKYNSIGRIGAYCLAGHHTGLPDFEHEMGVGGALSSRLQLTDELSAARQGNPPETVMAVPPPHTAPCGKAISSEYLNLWLRMMFSCLVDADRLNSEAAADPEKAAKRTPYRSLNELSAKLDAHLEKMQAGVPDTPINRQRRQILEQCRKKAVLPSGFFSLTVPTGGGKTLSALAFALRHALAHDKKRVIMAIPYTSIIEQTAKVYKDIFGDEQVLEHHSNLDPDKQSERAKLAVENWDAPLIVTTNVQLFESLFAAKSSSCRKIHNLSNSIIILDEAQMLPPEYLRPLLSGLRALTEAFGATVVLCTATQPALCGRIADQCPGLEKVTEIIDCPEELSAVLKRVELQFPHPDDPPSTWEEIAEKLQTYDQVLCIVNTRQSCRVLHGLMPAGTIQLSALMCGEERSKIIAGIKTGLRTGKPLRVISTQLVEAGVDIDFPVVFRAAAGLDSVAQAAGRCNREGRLNALGKLGQVIVFNPPQRAPTGLLRQGEEAFHWVLRHTPKLELAPRFYKLYFQEFFGKINFDKPRYQDRLVKDTRDLHFQFRTFARDFQLIDNQAQQAIIVQYRHSITLIDQLRRFGPSRNLQRKLQRYSVNVNRGLCNALVKAGMVEEFSGLYLQVDPGLYRPGVGLLDDAVPWNPDMYIQ